jgi:Uma2 family endonuclease
MMGGQDQPQHGRGSQLWPARIDMAVAPKRLTLEQFLQLPEEEPSLEFADGVVTQKVSPKGRHATLQGELIKQLDQAGLPGKLARAFPELRVTFGGASYVPDVSVFRRRRIPVDADGRIADDFWEPPDIAIEIVSPEQSVNALVRRCLWYVAHGVQVALLVDPADESVLAFRRDREAEAWHGADRIDLSEILPDFDLTVEQLFASLRQV